MSCEFYEWGFYIALTFLCAVLGCLLAYRGLEREFERRMQARRDALQTQWVDDPPTI